MLIEAPAHYVRRGRAEIRTGDPDVVHLACMLSGSRWLLNEAGETRLRRTGLFLTHSGRPFALDGGRGRYSGVTLALPRTELHGLDLARLSDPAVFDRLPTRELLRQTLFRAADALETDAPGEVAFLCSVALGALTLGLSRSRDRAIADSRPTVTAELIRLEIVRNLGDSDLTAERTAARLGLSVRALQRTLARQGRSFRCLVRDQRMDAAYQALVATAEPIDRIAVAYGYCELSSFYRAFRHRFGRTPVEVRSQTRQSGQCDRSLGEPRHSGCGGEDA
jgi:AraC-like DNA-binding protein